jgi:aspartate ammonia-lyase
VLRPNVAATIDQAADEIVAGRFDRTQFPVDVTCGGGGVSPNTNLNEVLASRANEILTGRRWWPRAGSNRQPSDFQELGQ